MIKWEQSSLTLFSVSDESNVIATEVDMGMEDKGHMDDRLFQMNCPKLMLGGGCGTMSSIGEWLQACDLDSCVMAATFTEAKGILEREYIWGEDGWNSPETMSSYLKCFVFLHTLPFSNL